MITTIFFAGDGRLPCFARLRLNTSSVALALAFIASLAQAGSATWNLAPKSGRWTVAGNWTPNTVPNGASDTATFSSSDVSSITVSDNIEVSDIVFAPGAPSFSFQQTPHVSESSAFVLSGAGIENNSGLLQSFFAQASNSGPSGGLNFVNGASAGVSISFTAQGGNGHAGAGIVFSDFSSAGDGQFVTLGGDNDGAGGRVLFNDSSTASNASFVADGGVREVATGGSILFGQNATAEHASFAINPSAVSGAGGGYLQFSDSATAGEASINTNGAEVSGAGGGSTGFVFSARADGSTLIANGGAGSGTDGGAVTFSYNATAENSVLIANGGTDGGNGGRIELSVDSDGGAARLEVFGNGNLDTGTHTAPGVSIGPWRETGKSFSAATT